MGSYRLTEKRDADRKAGWLASLATLPEAEGEPIRQWHKAMVVNEDQRKRRHKRKRKPK